MIKHTRYLHDLKIVKYMVSGIRSSSPGPIDEDSKPPPPNGFLNFHINERVARVAMWINQNFLVGEELEAATNELSGGSLELQFISLRNKEELYFNMSSDGNVSIKCNNMDLCGDLVQALAEYLGLGMLCFLSRILIKSISKLNTMIAFHRIPH